MRITISIIGLITILTGPWWLPALCMLLLSLRWAAIEAPLMGLLMDFVWQGSGTPAASWHTLPAQAGWPLFTLFGLALLWGLEPLRRRFLAA